MRTSDQGHFR